MLAGINDIFVPMLSSLIFVAIGVAVICSGLKQTKDEKETNLNGEEAYGFVARVYHLPYRHSMIHRSSIRIYAFNADIEIVERDGTIGRYTKQIGMSVDQRLLKYHPDDFILVKHYKNNITILKRLNYKEVPREYREKLRSGQWRRRIEQDPYANLHEEHDAISNDDTVIINGVEYTRKK